MMIRTAALAALVCLCACGKVNQQQPDAGLPAEIVSLEIDPATPPSIPLGLGTSLTATATYDDGSEEDVTAEATWSSDDEAIATVAGGAVASVGVGSATITASFDGQTGEVVVTVVDAELTSIEVDPPTAAIVAGGSRQFTATGQYTSGPVDLTATATWSTSNAGFASVVGGLVTGNTPGTVTVTATLDGTSGDATLDVTQAPLGTHPSNPGADCTDLLQQGVTSTGVYWIDPDPGSTGDAFQAYCDMTTDGGGWTLLVWTDDSGVTPLGLPYPGLAPCPGLDCARGSVAGDPQAEQLIRRSTEFGKGSTVGAGESIIPLGAHAYAGKYTYGSLDGLDLVYGAVTCSAAGWPGSFRMLTGPTSLDGTMVYLSQSLAYATYDFSGDGNQYIWDVGVPSAYCNGSGAMPGTWVGTWSSSQYGPYDITIGRHAVFVRGGTVPTLLGSTPENPGDSCLHIRNVGASTGDGVYWIDPQNTGAFQVLCDMTTDGGGWTITYDVDAAHFDGIYLNNYTSSPAAPTAQNQFGDIWNAEAVMPFTQTLWACGQQDNASTYYWRYNVATPHTWLANTTTDYYTVTLASTATNAATANCGGVSKNPSPGYGWVVLETGTSCGTCTNMLFGMYHYTASVGSPGCNSTSTTYGQHASPYDGRTIQYPICNLQQTSNGRFWMGVR